MIDFIKVKSELIREYAGSGVHSDEEIQAFHTGLNYLIDYISNEEERPLNDYVPDEVVYNKKNSRIAINSIRQEYKKKEKNIIENYRLRLKVKEILLERRLVALRAKLTKVADERCSQIQNEYEDKLSKDNQIIEELKQRIIELEVKLL